MRLTYEIDTDPPPQLGLIVLQADETIERDMRGLLPADAELLVSRVPSGDEVTPETLAAMEEHLGAAARLLPRRAALLALGYGCTSGAAQIGPHRVAAALRAESTARQVTEPLSALIAACAQLQIKRLAVLSPYVPVVSAKLFDRLATAGITVQGFASFEEGEEARVARISEASIVAAAHRLLADQPAEVLFLSCTNLRTLGVIDTLEAQLGLPVLSSNQVLAWHMMRLAGVRPRAGLPGRLWL